MAEVKKLAVIFGATSGQGLSVVQALHRSGKYRVRGVARSSSSSGAQALLQQGIELRHADFDDPTTLQHCLTDANIVFAVTKMYEGDTKREVAQGQNIANAVAAIDSVQHFVWSTLPSASSISKGQHVVPHLDGKAEVDEYILSVWPSLAYRTTFLWVGFYAENVLDPFFQPHFLSSAGKYVWIQPIGPETLIPLAGDHVSNVGVIVEKLLGQPHISLPRRYVSAVTEWVPNGDILRLWAHVSGELRGADAEAVYVKTDLDTVGSLWPKNGEEMGSMLRFLEAKGRMAWTKNGEKIIGLDDLGISIGSTDSGVANLEKSFRRIISRRREHRTKSSG